MVKPPAEDLTLMKHILTNLVLGNHIIEWALCPCRDVIENSTVIMSLQGHSFRLYHNSAEFAT